jgi:membrane protease YdiL (CAAX protease family)
MKQVNSALGYTINYRLNDTNSLSTRVKWSTFLSAFWWLVIIKMMFGVVFLVSKVIGFSAVEEILLNQTQFSSSLSESTILLYITIVGPIVEEISFRGWLTDKKYLALLCCFAFSVLITEIILDDLIRLTINRWFRITLDCLTGVSISSLLYRFWDRFILLLKSKFRYAVMFSCFTFAVIHILNYEIQQISLLSFLALLLIILPIYLMGFVLTYVRLKNGLMWSIGLHILNNSLILTFPMLR